MTIFCDYCGEYHSTQNCPYNLDAYGYMEDQNWNQQQNFSWYDQNAQNFLYHNNFAAAADMPWQYQPCYEHSNPLEQTLPTFTTSFDRLLEEMQNLNKSMEARLVKMDERMINWGGSTSVMDNMPKGTEIPRQEVGEQCEENPSMPTHHARAGVTANAWAEIATGSNATTTSHDAAKSDASANSTKSDAENDTITLMLKHEPINCSHPQFSRQPCGIKETTCPGSTKATCLGSTRTARLGSEETACPGSTKATCPDSEETAHPGSEETAHPGSKQTACLGSEEPVCPGSTEATCPGSEETAHPGSKRTTRPSNIEEFCHGGEQNDCFVSTSLSDMMTDYLENEAHSMVIPPTICAAPQSLLMEMFKKSEDNDTWKIDDFKKNVPSIDFQRILAEDCHGNWLEQQLPQQRRLHLTMLEVKANEVIKWLDVIKIFPNHMFMPSGTIARWSVYMHFKGERNKETSTMAAQREVAKIPLAQVFLGRIVTRWRVRMDYKNRTTINIDLPAQVPTAAHYLAEIPATVTPAQVPAAAYYLPKFLPTVPATALPPKADLARRIDRSKRRRLTFMAYPREFNKTIIQVIKDKFQESSTRSQCLNRNSAHFSALASHTNKIEIEVPGNRLPETSSRRILLHARGACSRLMTFRTRQGSNYGIGRGRVGEPAMADLSRIRHISCKPRFSRRGRRFPAQAEDFPPSQGSKLSRQDSKSITCRGRPGQEIQSGVRLDHHIFLSISVQRACQFDAEKIAKAGSQAHAQER
ncbi:hypothetical protein V6N11_005007 [Hibiscus sabdariffa]|uniref:Uncharacterized protein n=1 Tax=Hibiscus sabdariffa TaxID=183260 RepID=A0ABR2NHV8_9ROSI